MWIQHKNKKYQGKVEGIVKSKPSRTPEGNKSKILTDRNKGQDPNPKKYIGKKPRNKTTPEPEAETNFQGWCTNLEGWRFDLGTRASDKFPPKMR